MGEYAPYRPRAQGEPPAPAFPTEHVRQTVPEDAPAIAALISDRHGIPFERALDGVRREFAGIAAGRRRVLTVAEADGGVVAFGRIARLEGIEGAPSGWYLVGVIVHRAYRRQGIGRALTQARLAWIRERSREAWYFANKANEASIDLHAGVGFEEYARNFAYAPADLSADDGRLFRIELR